MILIIITCLLLILIVLVQNSKGGGLASNFASSNQFMGVRKTGDFLEKATWTLAACLLVFSILSTISLPKAEVDERARIEGQFDSNLLTSPGETTITLPQEPEEE